MAPSSHQSGAHSRAANRGARASEEKTLKKFGRAGTTFGTVVAAALVLAVATTGGAVAGGLITSKQIKNNTIKSIDVRDGNLTGADVKDGGLTSADLAAGTIPAVPHVRWALVSEDQSTILAQSGGISIVGHSGGVYLNMGATVAGSALSVTNAFLDTGSTLRGNAQASICGGAPYGATCIVPGTNTPNIVWVTTRNAANSSFESHAFYVSVIG